ncbi:hypothetical protein MNBD_GAMMA25-1886 [hydrothermal vent metagenome]|uniref:Uncharacterized protein n=1 Tax=hydrothermal vent metagenome TaxID=652676 RepID=A0A3B1AKI1_9ZZZZ
MRIKSRWSKKNKTHSVEEIAGAVAFILWRIATNGVLSLENEDYQTDSQQQRLDVITEFLAFSVHMTDRITIERFDENERVRFITELASKCAKHLEDNLRDVQGKGDYRQAFIDTLNRRMADYVDFSYSHEEGPSFNMKRFFGEQITKVLGERHSKWVSSQVMDIEVPEIMSHIKRAIPNLFK